MTNNTDNLSFHRGCIEVYTGLDAEGMAVAQVDIHENLLRILSECLETAIYRALVAREEDRKENENS